MPPLRPSESVEFARLLAGRLGFRGTDLSLLRPIIEYSGGNPLTLTVALSSFFGSQGKPTVRSVDAFVGQLENGEAAIRDDPKQGRSLSLSASLQYGFDSAFSNLSLQRLAILHVFRTYVNTGVLVLMGNRPDLKALNLSPDYEVSWSLNELSSQRPSALEELLHKTARLGLLTRVKENHYWMHPAIHIHLRAYFTRFYGQGEDATRVRRAFAESLGIFGIQFTIAYSHGIRAKAIDALSDEENNFSYALELSRERGWWQAAIGVLHGLFTLYEHTGRLDEWSELFESVVPDFLDQESQPLQGREKWWAFIMDHRQRVAYRRKDLSTAEILARTIVDHERSQCVALDPANVATLTASENTQLRSLAIAIGRLADVLRDTEDSGCVDLNEEALGLYRAVEDRVGVSVRLFNLGHVYKNVSGIRDLTKSAQYYFLESTDK